jgi:hypothetical protein
MSLSAGGHDEQPWLVNNSTTARVWAQAARMGSAQHHDINARTRQQRSISRSGWDAASLNEPRVHPPFTWQ